jgi:glycerophosphoryl diester phosphodiesterase
MKLIAETLAKVPSAPNTQWQDRIILGCWAAKFLPAAVEYLPSFPVTTIGFSIPYSRQFLDLPNITFNMLMAALVSPAGRRFIADAKAAGRPIYAWTANDEKTFDWSIRKGIDGVITDDPRKFIEFRDSWDVKKPKVQWTPKLLMTYVQINLFAWVFGWIFWRRYGFGLVREGKK